jgi:ERCC4-type nuclease
MKSVPSNDLPGLDDFPALAVAPEPPKKVICPFKIMIDTREQHPYLFDTLKTDSAQGSLPLEVPTERYALPNGDYMVLGIPWMVVERKSKEDLYSSISQRRDNFERRLCRMQEELRWAAIVVEAEMGSLLSAPPAFSQFSPKALNRTIMAWAQRYPRVHWFFLPSREFAEPYTFRLLERWWRDHKNDDRLVEL